MSAIVSINNLHKSFGTNKVLNGVSLDVQKGQMVAIIGRSGSGKSTLLRCLNGLERIDSGDINVCGHDIHHPDKLNLRELRKQVGIVFQSYNLFPHLTVERNITLALTTIKKMATAEAKKIAHNVLTLVGLEGKKEAYPEQLSGGQAQRVAIARSLAMRPSVMLFDEATSALDPELVGEVLNVIRSLAFDGMTMILVTHEIAFAREVADQVIFMRDGVVVEAGPPSQVIDNPQQAATQSFLTRFNG